MSWNRGRTFLRGDIKIRGLQPEDIPERVFVWSDPLSRSMANTAADITEVGTLQWLRGVLARDDREDFAVVIEPTGELVAFTGFMSEDGADLPRLYMVVHPSWRGRGIGRRAWEGTIELMRESGVPGASAVVRRDNPAMIAICRDFGFETVGGTSDGRVELQVKWS